MGLFKTKRNSSNNHHREKVTTTSSVNPAVDTFINRRLRVIKEDEEGSEKSFDGQQARSSTKRSSTTSTTPSKTTLGLPDLSNHRFHRLVEWDYGEDIKPTYEPPQDFIQLQNQQQPKQKQKPRHKTSTFKALNYPDTMTTESEQQPGVVKIFQFATDSAAISQSFSSDSGTSRSHNHSNGDNNHNDVVNDSFHVRPNQGSTTKTASITSAEGASMPTKNSNKHHHHVSKSNERSLFAGSKSKSNSTHKLAKSKTSSDGVNRAKLTHFSASMSSQSSSKSQRKQSDNHHKSSTATIEKKNKKHSSSFSSSSSSSIEIAENIFQETNNVFRENKMLLFGDDNNDTKENPSQNKKNSSSSSNNNKKNKDKSNDTLFDSEYNPFQMNANSQQKASIFDTSKNQKKEKTINENNIFNGIKDSTFDKVNKDEFLKYKQNMTRRDRPNNNTESDKLDPDNMLDVAGYNNLNGKPSSSSIEEALNSITDRIDNIAAQRNHFHHHQEGPKGPIKNWSGADPVYPTLDNTNIYNDTIVGKDSLLSSVDSYDSYNSGTSTVSSIMPSPKGIRGSFRNLASYTVLGASNNPMYMQQETKNQYSNRDHNHIKGMKSYNQQRPPTGVPPSSIMGSMLFRAENFDAHYKLDSPSTAATASARRKKCRDVPHSIHTDEIRFTNSNLSDFTCSTASEGMVESSSRILKCYNNRRGYQKENSPQTKRHMLSRKHQEKEEEDLIKFQSLLMGIQNERIKREQKLQSEAVLSAAWNPNIANHVDQRDKNSNNNVNNGIQGNWIEASLYEA